MLQMRPTRPSRSRACNLYNSKTPCADAEEAIVPVKIAKKADDLAEGSVVVPIKTSGALNQAAREAIRRQRLHLRRRLERRRP
jgi:hypothetical protein